jgi:hypothetical protein
MMIGIGIPISHSKMPFPMTLFSSRTCAAENEAAAKSVPEGQ